MRINSQKLKDAVSRLTCDEDQAVEAYRYAARALKSGEANGDYDLAAELAFGLVAD